MSVTITTVTSTAGLDRLIARSVTIPAIIADFAERIRATAEPLVPVDTGADVASLSVILEGMAARIQLGASFAVPYPAFQELGFHHHGTGQFIQNPALVPALEQHRDDFIAAIQAAIGGG